MNKIFLVLILGLISCGVKKIKVVDFSMPPKNTKDLISRVNSKKNYPQSINLKGMARILKKDQDISLKLNIKNRKDSLIWISGSVYFGIEVFRAKLTADSLYFLNRVNKTYLIKSISYLNNFIKADFSFNEIQDIIMANPKILKSNYKFEKEEDKFYLFSDQYSYSITNKYSIETAKFIDKNKSLALSFQDRQVEDDFPKKIELTIKGEEIFEIGLTYSAVELNNKSQKMLFEIPDSYNEIK